jgi:uroporphyrinogen decarboxylase
MLILFFSSAVLHRVREDDMSMTGRERLLTAIHRGKPDRLPCLIHAWIDYHLQTTMGGMDQFQAYARIGMDPVIYVVPNYLFDERDLDPWRVDQRDLGMDDAGNRLWQKTITTPDGTLVERGASNPFTTWTTEFLIKGERDFEMWERYVPLPSRIDWTPVLEAKERVGDQGMVRGYVYDWGQLSPWQTFSSCLYGVQPAIMACIDSPAWVHHVLDTLLQKKLASLARTDMIPYDLVESGGGGASSTVISPALHREFCLPYDQAQHRAIHEYGPTIVYHLCGGLMPMLELVAQNGADGLETMTPPPMGGDCDLAEARRRVGDRLFFIGGFDQNAGFERGNPALIREMVQQLHRACPEGGYICAPSDQFFYGSIENLSAFAQACRECTY